MPKWDTYSYLFFPSCRSDISLSGPSLSSESFLFLKMFETLLKHLKCCLLPAFLPALYILVPAGSFVYSFYYCIHLKDQVYWFINSSLQDSSGIGILFTTYLLVLLGKVYLNARFNDTVNILKSSLAFLNTCMSSICSFRSQAP